MNFSKEPPIWLQLHSDWFPPTGIVIDWNKACAVLLARVADKIEVRGAQGLDLDPGETADWLREEATLAQNNIGWPHE
jgi:hypothetical protein